MSKFYDIYTDLKSQIDNNKYRVGELIPSEHQLASEYCVSRETIRKALVALMEDGYIQKRQGKGSIVLDVHRYHFPVSGLTSFKELQDSQAIPSITRVVQNKRVKAPKFLADAGLVEADEEMILLVRHRIVDGRVIIVDKDYIRTTLVDELPTKKMEESLFSYLEDDLGLSIAYAKKEFRTEAISNENKMWMPDCDDSHVILVRSEMFLDNACFFQYTESRHCLDKFKFIEFARRRKQ